MPGYALHCDEIRLEGDELVFELDASVPTCLSVRCLVSLEDSGGRLVLRSGRTTITARARRIMGVEQARCAGSTVRPLVRVGQDGVRASGNHIRVGDVRFDLTDARELAVRGANVVLPNAYPSTPYRLLPAALAMLVAEAD